MGKGQSFQQMFLFTFKRINCSPNTKINPKFIIDLNIRPKTLLSEDNIEEKLHEIGIGNDSWK
jgi:hypothetical protein